MRVLYLVVLTIFLLSISTKALAEFDGNELLGYCTPVIKKENGDKLSTTELVLAAHCTGYVSGFIDSHVIDSYACEKYTQKKYCIASPILRSFNL